MFLFLQPCDESRCDQSALKTRSKKATLAVAGREQETLGEWGLGRRREENHQQNSPGQALELVLVQDATEALAMQL